MTTSFDFKTERAIQNATRICVIELISSLEHDPEWIEKIAGQVINRSWDEPQKAEDELSEEIISEIDDRISSMLHQIQIPVNAYLEEPYRTDHLNHWKHEASKSYGLIH